MHFNVTTVQWFLLLYLLTIHHNSWQLALGVEDVQGLGDSGAHGLLTLSDPHSWVKVLLVWLVVALWVTDRGHQVVLLVQDVVSDTGQVSVLTVSVQVDLDDTVLDTSVKLLLGGAGTTVENQVQWLRVGATNLLVGVLLVLAQNGRSQHNVTWLVDTVDVTEGGGNGEVWRDWGQGLVHGENGLWLGVQGLLVHVLVVDTVLFTTGDTNLHLEPLVHLGHSGEVLDTGGDVLVVGLLRQVQHVRGEQRSAVGGEKLLVGLQHAVEPRQQLLGTVVGVQNDWDAVGWRNGSDVVGSSNGASDGGVLVGVGDTLTGKVGSTTLRGLQDDRSLVVSGGFQSSNNGGRRSHVDGRNGKTLLSGVGEEFSDVVTVDDTGFF